ncbi:uncharacterized protein PRCAT00000712001 [Priceomyces carsonii]|uniref:uncharacterized protein n=1 Tax=Priceomyces carsonii TaxID=28549 RepID=UPI002ED86196|nr:unnamed protein product [Priceomyces carsonii]
MMLSKQIVLLVLMAVRCLGFQAVPLVVASHTLVKGLREEVDLSNLKIHNISSANNMVKKLITECSSDEYILIDQPGLTYTDMTVDKSGNWPFLRKYFELSSTLVGLPWVEKPLDMDFVEKYIIKNCEAETIEVVHENEDEVSNYIDTRKKVIKISLGELPLSSPEREEEIRQHDALARKIIRKLPSPHYTIILTSSLSLNIHPIPDFILERDPKLIEPFDDIINHPSRETEFEKNDRFRKGTPDWIPEKHTVERYLKNRKKDEIHLRKNELWTKHNKLVLTVLFMALSVFLINIFQCFSKSNEEPQLPKSASSLSNKKRD